LGGIRDTGIGYWLPFQVHRRADNSNHQVVSSDSVWNSKFLESRDIIIVDWEKLSWGLIEISQDVAEQSVSIIVSIMETGAFGVGFLGGYTMLGNIDFKKSLKI
tara:strand:+ start:204 stop:515 length:312 start_codon:yes stop_codon:yes gene_type:complete